MKTGRCGLKLTVVAIIAFALAILGRLDALMLVCAYAIFLEKDDWLTKQTISALVIYITYALTKLVLGMVLNVFIKLFSTIKVFMISGWFGTLNNAIVFILDIAFVVVMVIEIIKLASGKDIKIPILDKIFEGDFSNLFKGKAAGQQQVQTNQEEYAMPMTPPQTQTMVKNESVVSEMSQTPVEPIPTNEQSQTNVAAVSSNPIQASSTSFVPKQSNVNVMEEKEVEKEVEQEIQQEENVTTWICECGEENDGFFCVNCGKQKN